MIRIWIAPVLLVVIGQCCVAAESGVIQFNRDVLPILSDKCFHCHGPDSAARQGDLRLDLESEAKADRGERTVIVPHHPSESELVARITASDDALRMPPAGSVKALSSQEIEILVRWIEQGAPWETHWAFQPIRRPEVPDNGVTNPIDAFIRKRLSQEGLGPSKPADPSVLLRRISLDLTGLPPSLRDKEAFLSNPSVENYLKVVDQLLASPRFGEKMAWDWLEAARYADTHGFQKDNIRTMWVWRDWVVNAFNENKPFDEFTVEQLAGDLLPNATLEQRIATGFNRNHRINAEAGSIDEEFRVEYVADRLETMSTVWLGLTVGCARCHDHKFEPISQAEYYRLFAFFNNVDEKGNDGVGPAPEPSLTIPLPGYADQIAEAEARLQAANASLELQLDRLTDEFREWESSVRKLVENEQLWIVVPGKEIRGTDPQTRFSQLPDGSVLVSGSNPLNDVHELEVTVNVPIRLSTVRLEALTHPSLTNGSLARSFDGNFLLSEFEIELDGQRIPLLSAEADFFEPNHPPSDLLDGDPLTGWAVDGGKYRENRVVLLKLARPLSVSSGSRLLVRLRYESQEEQAMIGRFRISVAAQEYTLAQKDQTSLPLNVVEFLLTGGDDSIARETFRETTPFLKVARQLRDRAQQEAEKLKADSVTQVMLMEEREGPPRQTYILERGQYDQHGTPVEPGFPEIIDVPFPESKRLTRLDLARWLVHPRHPLTARVAVNRLWQTFFGVGIVKSTENLGIQGDRPSHPELLDWLAAEFIDSGWNVQHLIRLIVSSQTYQQSSQVSEELQQRDPENRLFARGPRYRLSAPMIRDQALFVSGLMNETQGGPPVKPYQPQGLWEAVAGVNSNTTHYEADSGGALYRRSLYTFWKRGVPPPGMILFDASSRNVCRVNRQATNSPLQALVLLNDITYVEAARVLAERAWRMSPHGSSPEKRLLRLWDLTQARVATVQQRQAIRKAYDRSLERYQSNPKAAQLRIAAGQSPVATDLPPVELAALSDVASILLNLDSTMSKE